MNARITHAPVVVSDQDAALAYYTEKVGFEKRADIKGPSGARWLTVAPKGGAVEFALVPGKQRTRVAGDTDPKAGSAGLQIALATKDCRGEYDAMKARGVRFDIAGYEKVQRAPWGTSAYFRDPDGNAWALVQQSWIGRMMTSGASVHLPLIVRDQDAALAFYVEKLGFEKRADYGAKGRPRWLTVAPPGSDVELALLKGEYVVDPRAEQGVQLTLTTSDCRAEAAKLKARGVAVDAVDQPFGTIAPFQDPDGNRFVLLQSKRGA